MRQPLLFLIYTLVGTFSAMAQVQLVLTDVDGEPLIGVNAYTTDYSFTAVSDYDGRLTVEPMPYADTLHLSYTGFASLHLPYVRLVKMRARSKGAPVSITLQPAQNLLDEVIVVGRTNDNAKELPWTVATVDAKAIAQINPQTAADALERSGEVYVQRSQMGGGSPIVRGFEANRVLLVVDGVRLNNAIYRSGHLQNAITVDPAMLDRVEVLFGAGSLLYGSDALGGVVHFRTREPKLYVGEGKGVRSSGNYFARFSSANLEKTAHVDYNLGHRTWASQTSLSVSSFADLRSGASYNHEYTGFGRTPFFVANPSAGEVRQNADPHVQRGTGYDQIDLMQKLKWQLGRDRYLLANVQYSNSTDVPRYDQLSQVSGDGPRDLKFAEWYYGPQQRLFGSLRFVSSAAKRFSDRSQIIAAYQRIDEDRYQRKLDAMWRDFSLVDVGVASLTFDADKYLANAEKHRLSYGVEVQHNTVASLGGRSHLGNGDVLLDRLSRYPSGGSTLLSGGAYTTYRYGAPGDRFHAQAGLRYSRVYVSSVFGNERMDEPVDWPQVLRDGVTLDNDAFTYAAGFTVEATRSTTIQMLGSTAFRTPNVDDFGVMRVKNGFVSVPNIDLRPERGLNAEVTLTQNLAGNVDRPSAGFAGRVSATAFVSKVKDVIVRANGALPNGDTTFSSSGEVYRVQVKTNAETGFIRGIGLRADATFGPNFKLAGRATLTEGTATDADGVELPLSHIPPSYGQVTAGYTVGRMELAAGYRFNGAKRWEDYAPAGSSDNEDLAIEGVGTPAWSVLDISASARLGKTLRLQAAVENLADLHYRPFSSGVSAPGRNIILSLRGSF